MAGQQFQYQFDTIGNRTSTGAGGDQNGANLRSTSYTANNLNHTPSAPSLGAVDIMGLGFATNQVTVNGQTAYRKVEYFRQQLSVANTNNAVWLGITNAESGQTSVTGNLFVAKSPELFSYDADGNLTNDGRWSYIWDAENRLVSMTNNATCGPQQLIAFGYDWKGRRIRKQVSASGTMTNNTTFVYDGWNPIARLNATNSSVAQSYMWGLDLSGSIQGGGGVGGLLEVNDTANGVHFFAYDGNGSVAGLAKANDGTSSAVYEYGPFGEVIRSTGPMAKANPFRFSTKYQDDETDLLYYGYRFYNASTGRWLSRDPASHVVGNGVRPRALALPREEANPYRFSDNDGLNRYDYMGLHTRDCDCHCGPVVDDVLQKLYWSMRDKFDKADGKTKKKACRALIDIPDAGDSWDFSGLKFWNWQGTPPVPGQCPLCSKAVTYRGRCVKQNVLNYVFFSIAANLCDGDGIEPIGPGYIDQEILLLYLRDSWGSSRADIQGKVGAMLDGYDLFTGPSHVPAMKGCLPRSSAALDPGASPINPDNWRWQYLY